MYVVGKETSEIGNRRIVDRGIGNCRGQTHYFIFFKLKEKDEVMRFDLSSLSHL